ncbi:HD domain-containing protein, partial [Elioraea sp.]|uniref:HD domain-containing protein n=1 Tax=Elioraea sp. TaxID=2185103 RepID=UPI003F71C18B
GAPGAAHYGEGVSQRAHALQSAWLAEQAGAPAVLIAAALMHDIGHLLHGLPEDIAAHGIDGRHEEIGAAWAARHFLPVAAAPVHLHVAAKRYLVATEPDYAATLSPASARSLGLQGGPMSTEECRAFRALPGAADAVALRRWDDAAKVVGLATPPLSRWRPHLLAALRVA